MEAPAPPPPAPMAPLPDLAYTSGRSIVYTGLRELPSSGTDGSPGQISVSITGGRFPHVHRLWPIMDGCPALHTQYMIPDPVYKCCVIRREPSSSRRRPSWKNSPHIAWRHITAAEVNRLRREHRRNGGNSSVEGQYDQLKHSSMRMAVDGALLICNTEEQVRHEAIHWTWRLALVLSEQRCVGFSILPTKFETNQIRVVFQRIIDPEFSDSWTEQARSAKMGKNHPLHDNSVPRRQAQSVSGHELQKQPEAIRDSRLYPSSVQYLAPSHYTKPWVDHNLTFNSGSDYGPSMKGMKRGETKLHNPAGCSKRLTARAVVPVKCLEQPLRKYSSDSDSIDQKSVKDTRQTKREGKTVNPESRYYSNCHVRLRRNRRIKDEADQKSARAYEDSDEDLGNLDVGCKTPPSAVSDDGSLNHTAPMRYGIPHRHDTNIKQGHLLQRSRQHSASAVRLPDFSATPPQPDRLDQSWTQVGPVRDDSSRDRERLAYIAGRQNERQSGSRRNRLHPD